MRTVLRTAFRGGPNRRTVVYAPAVTTLRRSLGRSGRGARLAAGALAGALVLAACGSHSSSSARPDLPGQATTRSPQKYEPTRRDFAAIRTLLDHRARAVLHDDESAFLATVDQRDHDLVAQQRTLFQNMAQLSVSSLSYTMDPSALLVPAAVEGDGPSVRPEIFEFLQIAGTLQHPVTNALEETFVKRGHRWLLGAETTPDDNEAFDSAQERPWYGVPIVARRLGPMTVLVDRDRAPTLDPLTTAIHDHIRFDADTLGVPASYRILVDATSNGNPTVFSSTSTEQAAAVTFGLGEADREDPTRFKALAGMAIKINPHEAGSYADDAGLLRHELTHFLLRTYSGSSPKWLVEGVATWIQYYPDSFATTQVTDDVYRRLQAADRRLPVLGLFNDDPQVNYDIAQAAVTWLVEHYGMPKLLALMRAYRQNYAGVDTDSLTPRMLRQVYGIGEPAVVAGAFGLLDQLQH
jgi:hypothetical protein